MSHLYALHMPVCYVPPLCMAATCLYAPDPPRAPSSARRRGWGQSFHFSPRLPGKSVAASEAAHEARIAAILGLAPGKKVQRSAGRFL